MTKLDDFLKFTTMCTAIPGAILVALHIPESKYGFPLFLYASTTWIYLAFKMKEKSLMLIETAFTLINLIGIYRWMT